MIFAIIVLYLRSAMEAPSPKLTVSLKQLSKPEPDGC